MEVHELWGCPFLTGKYQSSSSFSAAMHQSSSLYLEGDDDTWEFFSCPFCYVDVEVPVLCNHLQEEHCFDTKNAVCPICADNLGKDMIGHFILQHSHMLKRRKSQRPNLWNSNTTTVEKEKHKISSLRAVTLANNWGNAPDCAADPLLSPFICSTTFPDTEGNSEANCETGPRVVLRYLHVQSLEPCISNKVSEQHYEERSRIAEFVQQVLLSTMY